jgi:hypothetical protein
MNFEEKIIERLKRLEREVERLRVKERPAGGSGVTDHGALTGLSDDDHPQYLLTTAKAADSDKLDGQLGSWYLSTTGKAADSDKLDGLDSTAFGRPVFLAAPLTSTAWDGDAFSTTAKTKIDLSVVFGVPAGAKAILVRLAARDSGSSAGYCQFGLSPNATFDSVAAQAYLQGVPNDVYVSVNGVVPCDKNGDVYYQITASGTGTLDAFIEIWGYWL